MQKKHKPQSPNGSGHKWIMAHLGYDDDWCLLWPFTPKSSGYGQFMLDGKFHQSHRYMCRMVHGEPPTEKHQAAHSCGNPRCCNPRHLSWKTPSENQADREKHGTHQNGKRWKLTPAKVAAIRLLDGDEPVNVTAQRFGVTEASIRQIQTRQTWRTGQRVAGGFQRTA